MWRVEFFKIGKRDFTFIREMRVHMQKEYNFYMLKTDKEAYLNSMREKDIHRSLIHPNIVRMLEIIEDESPESSDNDK